MNVCITTHSLIMVLKHLGIKMDENHFGEKVGKYKDFEIL